MRRELQQMPSVPAGHGHDIFAGSAQRAVGSTVGSPALSGLNQTFGQPGRVGRMQGTPAQLTIQHPAGSPPVGALASGFAALETRGRSESPQRGWRGRSLGKPESPHLRTPSCRAEPRPYPMDSLRSDSPQARQKAMTRAGSGFDRVAWPRMPQGCQSSSRALNPAAALHYGCAGPLQGDFAEQMRLCGHPSQPSFGPGSPAPWLAWP